MEGSRNFDDQPLKGAMPAIGLLLEANLDWQWATGNGQGAARFSHLPFCFLCSFFVFLVPPCTAVLVVQLFLPERQVFRFTLFLNSVLSLLLRHPLCRNSKLHCFPVRPGTASSHLSRPPLQYFNQLQKLSTYDAFVASPDDSTTIADSPCLLAPHHHGLRASLHPVAL